MLEYMLSVMSLDRPGIVAAVSGALTKLGGNITHLSETVVRGYFTMTLAVEAPDDVDAGKLAEAARQAGAPGEFQVGVLGYCAQPERVMPHMEQFVLTGRGKDAKGILHQITSLLASRGINIDDFYAFVVDGESVMILEIGIMEQSELQDLRTAIDALSTRSGFRFHLQHKDIISATTELQAVLRLGDKR